MDVKEIQGIVLAPEQSLKNQPVSSGVSTPVVTGASISDSADVVTVASSQRVRTALTVQNSLNETIATINSAADAADEIARFAKGIAGFTEQALEPTISDQKRDLLEREANELVTAIRLQVEAVSSHGAKPLSGDSIRVEIEEKFGKTLEVLLPDDARRNFGLGTISFSPREAILQTRTTIAEAEARIKNLQEAIASTKDQLKESLNKIEVARQNQEAAATSIRDVDEALNVAGLTRSNILDDPGGALKSFDKLTATSLELLK